MITLGRKATRRNVVERTSTTLRSMLRMTRKLTRSLTALTKTASMASKKKMKRTWRKRPD
jgi:hypothetical protein